MEYKLNSVSYGILNGNEDLKDFVVPSSVTQLSQIDDNAFSGSSLTSVIFLGLASSQVNDIKSSYMFGVGHDCWFTTSDSKRFKWIESSKTTTEDTSYKQLGSAKITTGKPNKMWLGRKIYRLEQQLYEWCTIPEKQDTKKFISPNICPLVIIYGDFKTSIVSRRFLANVLENDGLYSWLKDSVKCYMFFVDRNGAGICSSSAASTSYSFFKTIHPEDGCKDFIVVDFIYKTTIITKTFSDGGLGEFKTFFNNGMEQAGFSSFDYEPFDIRFIEDPYEEAIPTTNPSVQSGYDPWWWDGSSIKTLPDWNP